MGWLEWIGYLASLIILISLLMSSIKKLRWVNLVGAMLFAVYGFLIDALPVGIMNVGIATINIYYLIKMYSAVDYFKVLPIDNNTKYLNYFLDFYKDNIHEFMNYTQEDIINSHISFFILRNIYPAGVFICSKFDETTLKIEIDYVVPEFRDFKIGNFVFEKQKEYFLERGYVRFVIESTNKNHVEYLKKMGFTKSESIGVNYFEKKIKD